LPSITGAFSNLGIVTGLAFSAGRTTTPFALGAAGEPGLAALELVEEFAAGDGAGGAGLADGTGFLDSSGVAAGFSAVTFNLAGEAEGDGADDGAAEVVKGDVCDKTFGEKTKTAQISRTVLSIIPALPFAESNSRLKPSLKLFVRSAADVERIAVGETDP
jgi:hypothetical protein